jgi:vanillate O-demethylase monooxygenase subunit
MFVRNCWYVAAWDAEVDRKPFARTICGEPMVLYRRLDRSLVALRDACPHRLLPLSMGIKEGDNIRCRYHGLLLDSDGMAVEMPVKTDRVNRSICAQKYKTAERHRFVWVWLGDAEAADEALIPNFWPCSDPDWAFDGGYYHIGCDYRLAIDNLMDLTHETYTHQGSIGQVEIMEAELKTEARGDEVFVTRWMPGIEPPPFWRDALKRDGPVDRWQICHFLPPSSVLIDVGVAPVGAGATIEKHDQGVRGFVVDALTPETATSSHYFWGMARNFDIRDTGFTARFKTQQSGVFLEDVAVLEAQQRSIEANPDMKLRAFNIDAGGVRSRMVIDRLLKAPEAV